MSPSEGGAARLDAVAAELRALAALPEDLPPASLRGLISAVTLLYGAAARLRGHEIALDDPSVSATDSVVLCCALLRAQGLNPFDLTLWFGRITPDPVAAST